MAKITDVALIAGIGAGLYFLIQAGKGLADTFTRTNITPNIPTYSLDPFNPSIFGFTSPLWVAQQLGDIVGSMWDSLRDSLSGILGGSTPVEANQVQSGTTGETYFVDPALSGYPVDFFDCVMSGKSATECKLLYPEGSTPTHEIISPLPEIIPEIPITVPATLTPRTHAECYGTDGRGAYSIGDYQLCLEGYPYKKGY